MLSGDVLRLSFITSHVLSSVKQGMYYAVLAQVSQGGDTLGSILQIVYLLSFVIFIFYGQKFQTWMMLREIEGAVIRLRIIRDEAKKLTVEAVQEFGNKNTDPTPRIEHFMEYFMIMPASLDPAGIVPKISHMIDVREKRFESEVALIAPAANEAQQNDLEGVLEVAIGLNLIYRVVNHFYLMGKKTMSLYVIMQIQMQLPQIMQIAHAYDAALKAFRDGQPIGDGTGALVAAKLMFNHPSRAVAKDVIATDVDFEGRKLIVMKAEGPGATVGKPGEAVEKIVEDIHSEGGQVAMIVMIDAASKFEGEKSGETSEGVGAAIGGIGVEQFEIEQVATKYNIPIQAVIVKESVEESVAPMTKAISEGTNVALARVKRMILEGTKEGDIAIVAGIGNTVGIGQ